MTAVVLWMMAAIIGAAEGQDLSAGVADKNQLDRMASQPVDISPWCYEWRADRAVQPQPEACFIPHRLERIDKVYRTYLDISLCIVCAGVFT